MRTISHWWCQPIILKHAHCVGLISFQSIVAGARTDVRSLPPQRSRTPKLAFFTLMAPEGRS